MAFENIDRPPRRDANDAVGRVGPIILPGEVIDEILGIIPITPLRRKRLGGRRSGRGAVRGGSDEII